MREWQWKAQKHSQNVRLNLRCRLNFQGRNSLVEYGGDLTREEALLSGIAQRISESASW
jgi:hypothetical protein